MMFVKTSSLVKCFSMQPNDAFGGHPETTENFSMMYEARPAGESFNPKPTVSGLVARNKVSSKSLDRIGNYWRACW